jgi:hypothetical protein
VKNFIYFEEYDGGMYLNEGSSPESFGLIGWMRGDCVKDDTELMQWAENADVGDYFSHRLGYAVRVKDT